MVENKEIERKFLVKSDDFRREAVRKYEIRQGYLAREEGRSVRVRLRDEEGFLTIKGPSDTSGLSRFEWERSLTREDAEALLDQCLFFVEKTRYIIPLSSDLFFEVDVFHGANEGLIIAEIELPSPDTTFDRPSWLGEEVTGKLKYYNTSLATPHSREVE